MADRPNVVKGTLKFKSSNSNQKKITVDLPPKNQAPQEEAA